MARELMSPATTQGDTAPPQSQRTRFFPRFIAANLLLTLGAGVVPVTALMLKTGEVMAKDGPVHVGASPRNRANVIANAKRRDELAHEVEHFIDELETMVDDGVADEMENFMSNLSQIEDGIETIFGFEGYDERVAGGGSVCDLAKAAHDSSGLE